MKIRTIEDRLFAESDLALRENIKKLSGPFIDLFRVSDWMSLTTDKGESVMVNSLCCVESLCELAFELHRDEERERCVREFMERIKNFSDDYAQAL